MNTVDPSHKPSCPLFPVDRRLEDVHQQWHLAEAQYFRPEAFRVAIQTTVQMLRTVTFVLQHNKSKIPRFESWYQAWQEKLKTESLMRWMVDARNKIEKQGDLEINSFVRAEIVASYMHEKRLETEVPAHLFDDPLSIVRRIPKGDLKNHILQHGTLKIQRRWVENTLPEHEFLEAIAIAYGRISELVDDAHLQIGLGVPTTINLNTNEQYNSKAREGRLTCMIDHEDDRTLNVRLSDGSLLKLEQVTHEFNKTDRKKINRRYGDIDKNMFGSADDNEEKMIKSLFATARKVFEIDGYHQIMFFCFDNVNW